MAPNPFGGAFDNHISPMLDGANQGTGRAQGVVDN